MGSPARTITDCCLDFGAGVASNDPNFGNPRLDHVFDAEKQNGFVGYRHQLLGAGVGNRPQSCPGPAGENESLHGKVSSRGCL
ncbi:unannotated protein [freshwater metagenome]|uniref:Unannotated protein n=1 Tax=freshwater metagenome TaxID=449393 RepID=A0A6J6ANJ7_9ZZZZ